MSPSARSNVVSSGDLPVIAERALEPASLRTGNPWGPGLRHRGIADLRLHVVAETSQPPSLSVGLGDD